jgi:AraC-like DNA-binding protein
MSGDDRELLEQFRLYSTKDADEARRLVNDHFGAELDTSDPAGFSARLNFVNLPNLHIFYSAGVSSTSVTVPRNPATNVHLILRGRCGLTTDQQRVETSDGGAYVCSEGRPARLDYATDYEKLVLVVPPAMLDRTFAALTGFAPKCIIEFEPSLDTSDPRFAGFRDLVCMLAGRLEPTFSAWPQATLEQLETACVTSLLFCSRHNLSHLLDGIPCSDLPKPVRVAEQFAEANVERDIGVEEMAKTAAVSMSTLTRAFLKYRGYTPAAFIKRTRLAHAKALLESDPQASVVGVALRCGFSNPSRFGRDYHQVFGETPTETLRRLRAQVVA